MHQIEPFYRWEDQYVASEDEFSPFFGREYCFTQYTNDIYGYYIHPYWDYIGSETLYMKILFADYRRGYAIFEMLGEWNDTLHNDVMYLKRNIVDHLLKRGINHFILIGENVMNFHGGDDDYYQEWFEDVEDGWIVALNFRDFVKAEWQKYNLDYYINFGGELDLINWRTMSPLMLYDRVRSEITYRLG